MGLHVKAHEARGLSAWRYTEVLNLSVSPRWEENLNSTREACIACFQYYIWITAVSLTSIEIHDKNTSSL